MGDHIFFSPTLIRENYLTTRHVSTCKLRVQVYTVYFCLWKHSGVLVLSVGEGQSMRFPGWVRGGQAGAHGGWFSYRDCQFLFIQGSPWEEDCLM